MTSEDKELLLKDLCARLPYGVKCIVTHSRTESGQKGDCGKLSTICPECIDCLDYEGNFFTEFGDFKPYLFPLSSMTDEQEEEYNNLNGYELGCFPHTEEALDYLIRNHFDYRYLINKGLAIDCTNLNIY
jgi:hypothetical protein